MLQRKKKNWYLLSLPMTKTKNWMQNTPSNMKLVKTLDHCSHTPTNEWMYKK